MSYFDDEPILANKDDLGKPRAFPGGKTKLRVINKEKAPLGETKLKVLLELIGSGSKGDESPGVDIVAVLDVSGSMGDDQKLEKMKIAMQFVIKKLSSAHRLSIVKFSSAPQRLCPLRQMNENAQAEVEKLVDGLSAGGGTNISGALRMALKVLEQRKLSSGRAAAIMLMSDGDQGQRYEDARLVPVDKVPVHTFGFGRGFEYNPEVLNAIADKSNGGTFSIADIENAETDLLSIAFSQCLGGLLTVIVQELKLTITPVKVKIGDKIIEPKIIKVAAGSYPQSRPDANGSRTIDFGDLYNKETRKVMVDLVLPKVDFSSETGTELLKINYQYLFGEQLFESPPVGVSVIRTGEGVDEENQEVVDEDQRLETVDKMSKATNLADQNRFPEAQNELQKAQNSLGAVKPSQLIEMLKYEVGQLLEFMQSREIYNSKGKHFALASLTSHARQRYAARGDPAKLRLFATPAMDTLLLQVINFIKDPTVAPPIVVEADVVEPEQVAVNNPMAHMIEPLSRHLGTAIQSLKAIQDALQEIQNLLNASI